MATDRTAYYKQYRERPEIKERQRIHQFNWRRRHPKKALEATRENRRKHQQQRNEYARKKSKIRIAFLSDYYVAFLIKRQTKYLLSTKDIPKDLIESQRLLITINRKLKQAI